VPELIVASSIPRLVHESAHHLYESCCASTPIRRRGAWRTDKNDHLL
jgi:hypothetical protein